MKFKDNPRLKHGTLSTIITIGFIVIVVLINIILNIIFKRNPLTIDLTSDSRYEITQSTIDFLNTIDQEVLITVCGVEEELANSEYETLKQAYEIIIGYPKISDNIKVKFVDLIQDPTFAKQYPDEEFYIDDIYITSNEKSKKIQMGYMFQTSQDPTTGDILYRSLAEQMITSAIDYVVDLNPVTVSVLTGINSVDITAFTNLLEINNYNIIEQNFLLDEINQEAKILILPQPAIDLTENQLEQIERFLENNGNYGKSLIFIPSFQREIEPVLSKLLADWGIKVENSILIETDSSKYFQDVDTMMITEYVDEVFKQTVDVQQPVMVASGRPINVLFEESGNNTTKILMSTSKTAISVPFTEFEKSYDNFEKSSYPTLVIVEKSSLVDDIEVKSNIICLSSETVVSDWFLNYGGFGNTTTYLSLVSTLADKEANVEVVPVIFDNQTILITSKAVKVYSIYFSIILPLIVLGIGLYVWLRRRHL